MPKETPQSRYDKEKTVQFKLKLVRGTDGDIINYLEAQPNKQGYIKKLIRADIKRQSQ